MNYNRIEQPVDEPIRVFLVDDHPILRRGLKTLLEAEADLEVTGEADSILHAAEQIERIRPHVVIIDLNLGCESGFDLLCYIQDQWLGMRTIVLSQYPLELYAEKAIAAGASGYVCKDQAPEHIVSAIRKVKNGDYFF